MEMSFPLTTNTSPLFGEFVTASWLPHIQAHNASWKLAKNICKNHILPEFGSKRLTSITTDDVQKWLACTEKPTCAPSTYNRRLQVLKSIFRLARENGLLIESPTSGIHTKRIKKTRWPSLDRAHLFLLQAALEDSPKVEAKAIALLLFTGARKNEILRARWENLFLQEGVLLVSRVGIPPYRRIWLSAEAQAIFRTIPRHPDSPWIFPGRDNAKPISDIFWFWKGLRSELGLDTLSIRDLRYIFADLQLRGGMSIHTLRRSMGVKDLRELNARLLCSGVLPVIHQS